LISSREVERVVEFVKKSGDVDYSDEVLEPIEKNVTEGKDSSSAGDQASELDEVFNEAVEVILDSGQASVSMLQRRLRLGYARAARLVDQMESRGIVGPFEGAKPRSLLITKDQWEEMKLQNTDYQ
jgi:S-DNA-T family DNA segregation ATPase FtsK/SpoIIIE